LLSAAEVGKEASGPEKGASAWLPRLLVHETHEPIFKPPWCGRREPDSSVRDGCVSDILRL